LRPRSSGSKLGSPVPAVFLVGFMGAGKSSVGRALGKALNCGFEDLDDRIERSEGRNIAEIFRASGEIEFRRVERVALQQLLREMADGDVRVIGLGGGAFVQADNAAVLKAAGVFTVFLDAPVDELWRRCVEQADGQGLRRPLLRSMVRFRTLHENRQAAYRKASMRIQTGGRTVGEIVEEIAKIVRLKWQQSK
jgi:shikimate kinase